MISRIRIDAYGKTAQDCDDALNRYAVWVQEKFGIRCSFGERVLEHQEGEPLGSDFYYKGRVSLHFELLTANGPATHGAGGAAATVEVVSAQPGVTVNGLAAPVG